MPGIIQKILADHRIAIRKVIGTYMRRGRLDRRRLERQLYYGLAVLAALFVVVGLTAALKGAGKKQEGRQEEERRIRKEQAEEASPKEPAQNPLIRVLLMTDGYQHTVHPAVSLISGSGLIVTAGEESEEWPAESELAIAPDDARFQKGNIRIQAKEGKVTVNSLYRGYGTPSYEGVIELRATAEGIAMINELPVEDYLCGVIPSEMPSSYEPEALKAQAVCARSFAYRQMEEYGYPEYEAHVNDSTDYQVYGNSEAADSTKAAVAETAGEVVRYRGQIVTTYYYSTSCGTTTSLEAWGTAPSEENAYLQSVEVEGEEGDYERDLPWYRWEASIPIATLSDLVGLNTGIDVGTLSSINILETGPGGVAVRIEAVGDRGSVVVETENKIRRALGGPGYTIQKQDGSSADSSRLLPSAFFTIENTGDAFLIKGGGFGHGIGMSQNGANEMAKEGKDYKEILTLFYQGVTVE